MSPKSNKTRTGFLTGSPLKLYTSLLQISTAIAPIGERDQKRREENMANLLAWAADVVGGGRQGNGEGDSNLIPIVFTPEQQNYVQELDQKAASLSRSIQDLRLRLPPPDISQRLPHLHAHSLASNAALALQLNAHSTTREQVLASSKSFVSLNFLSFFLIWVIANLPLCYSNRFISSSK